MRVYQEKAETALHANPAVDMTFTMTGNSSFLPGNQGFLFAFLKDPKQRPPIEAVAGQLMGAVNSQIPGAAAFLQPNPVLRSALAPPLTSRDSLPTPFQDLTRRGLLRRRQAHAKNLSVSWLSFRQFRSVQSHAQFSGRTSCAIRPSSTASPRRAFWTCCTRLFAELHLPDQEAQRSISSHSRSRRRRSRRPRDLGLLYIKSDDGQRMVPLHAVTQWEPLIGPQAVNHINQFTSVTLFFNLKPGYTIGDATHFVITPPRKFCPPDVQGGLQGEALRFRDTVASLTILMVLAVFVMYVILAILYESYLHPITVLSSLPVALVGGLLTLEFFGAEASLYAFIGMFMLMGIVKKTAS